MPRLSQRRRGFWRAVALAAVVIFASPLASTPLGPLALVGLPTALGLLTFQRRSPASLALAVALIATAAIGIQNPPDLWYVERGWAILVAGGFTAATALAPSRSIFERSMAAVVVSVLTVGVAAWLSPELLSNLDWRITGQFDRTLSLFDLEGLRAAQLAEAMRQVVRLLEIVYPAMLVLASLAALGCASYVLGRMEGDESPLPPLRQFRFSDNFAWVMVLGLALLVLPVGVWAARTGGNVVTVMGGLYVLRGAAVLVWLGTSVVTSGWSVALWVIAALFFYPVTIGTAFVMGLSDTWLDLRSRLRVEADGD